MSTQGKSSRSPTGRRRSAEESTPAGPQPPVLQPAVPPEGDRPAGRGVGTRRRSAEPPERRPGTAPQSHRRSPARRPGAPTPPAPPGKMRGIMLNPTGMTIGQKITVALVFVSCLIAIALGIRSTIVFTASLEKNIISAGQIHVESTREIGAEYVRRSDLLDARINSRLEKLLELREDDPANEPLRQTLLEDIEKSQAEQKQLSSKFTSMLPFGEGIETCTIKFTNLDRRDLARGNLSGFQQELVVKRIEPGIEVSQGRREGHGILSFEYEIDLNGTPATIYLQLSAEDIDGAVNTIRLSVLLASVIAIIAGSLIGWLLAARITAPIRQLVDDIQVVATGDFDHRTRAASHDEVGVMARAFDAMTQGLKAARDAEVEHRARERELAIAGQIQENLLPRRIPELSGIDIAEHYKATKEVGGDYFDFIPLDDDRLAFVIADVSGKGVPGAMVMTMVRALLRMEAAQNTSTAGILCKVNQVVHQDIKRGMFVTAMMGILDVRTRKFLVSSAGHNPLIVYRARTQRCEDHNPLGIALGFDSGPIFESRIEQEEISLKPGDRVVMYTDGVVEAMNEAREEFGEARLSRLVEEAGDTSSREFVTRLLAELGEHQGAAPQHDDITIVTFRIMGVESGQDA